MRRLAVILVLFSLAGGRAHGQACEDYASYTRVIADEVLPTNAGQIVVSGNYAYAATSVWDAPFGLMVLDVTDPIGPELVGTGGNYWLDTGFGRIQYGLDVAGDLVYLLGDAGLEIVDVQDPTTPLGLGHVGLSDPRAIDVVADDAFVADYQDGLVVIDVADPLAPATQATLGLGGNAYDVVVDGNHAYVATVDSLIVVDVATPATPVVVGSLFVNGGSLRTITKSGDTVYLGQFSPNAGIFAVDVSNPAAPSHLGDLYIDYPYSIEVVGTTAYVASGYGELYFVDVSNPAAMDAYHWIDANGRDIDVVGTHLFMGSSNAQPRFKTIELATHDTPAQDSSYIFLPTVRYVRMGSGAAQVIGVKDNYYVLDTLDITGGGVYFTMLSRRIICRYDPFSELDLGPGMLAFAAYDEVFLVDISDPYDTRVAGSFVHGEMIRSVVLDGPILYVVDQYGIHTYDITDPGAAVNTGFKQQGNLYGACRQGDLLFGSHSVKGLIIFGLADPNLLTVEGTINTGDYRGVAVSGDHAYLTGSFVTAIADVSNPQAPFLTWESGSISDSENIQVFGDLVASPAGCGSLEILDVSDPAAPAMLGSPRAPSCNSLDVAMSAGFVLIAAGNDGLLAYPGHCAAVSSAPVSEVPRSFGSITVAPNPFNPMTQIGVSIPAPTVMTLRVYGLDGKMVKELYDGEVEAGHHQFTWDGRDVFGRPVGSGTYITLLDSPLGRQTRSMLLIK